MIDTVSGGGFRSVGQPVARRIARQAIGPSAGRTLLVHGPRGAGKGAFVDDLLALFFCELPDAAERPCNACRGCRDGRTRTHPDLVVGSPETWREMRGSGESIVAAARRWLLDAAGAPVRAARRIVLIEDAERAGEAIQNALLKALEEPTDRHAFVLVADEPSALLPTIRSRSQPLRLGPVARDELVAHLMDDLRLPADLAETLARISHNLVGTAERLATEKGLLDWRRRVQLELLELLGRGRADRFGSIRDLLDDAARVARPSLVEADAEGDEVRTPAGVQRAGASVLVDAWLSLTRDLLVTAGGRPDQASGEELDPQLTAAARRLDPSALAGMARLLEAIHDGLGQNTAPRLALERAMLAWPVLSATDAR